MDVISLSFMQGVNLEAIKLICHDKEFVTLTEAFICINSSEIYHPLLQSAYFDFVKSACIDLNVEEAGADIDHTWRCQVSIHKTDC